MIEIVLGLALSACAVQIVQQRRALTKLENLNNRQHERLTRKDAAIGTLQGIIDSDEELIAQQGETISDLQETVVDCENAVVRLSRALRRQQSQVRYLTPCERAQMADIQAQARLN